MLEIFENVDLVVETFSCAIALLIALGSFYAYSKTRKASHAAFGFSFLLVAAGAFFSVIFNSMVELEVLRIPLRGYIGISYTLATLLLLSMFLSIAGFATLYMTTQHITDPGTILLLYLLAPLGAWLAHEVYAGYYAILLILVLLVFIHYWRVHEAEPSRNNLLVTSAFGVLVLSQGVFLFTEVDPLFYVAGHVLRFIGFLLLFVTLVMIFRSPTTKKHPSRT